MVEFDSLLSDLEFIIYFSEYLSQGCPSGGFAMSVMIQGHYFHLSLKTLVFMAVLDRMTRVS